MPIGQYTRLSKNNPDVTFGVKYTVPEDNIIATGETVTVPLPSEVSTCFIRPNGWDSNRLNSEVRFCLRTADGTVPSTSSWDERFFRGDVDYSYKSGIYYNVPFSDALFTNRARTFKTSNIFNSSNNNTNVVNLKLYAVLQLSYNAMTSSDYGSIWDETWNELTYVPISITLNAPPSCSFTQLTDISSMSQWYQGRSVARTTISEAAAQYGGTVTKIKLIVGNSSAEITGNGNIDVPITDSGVITPQLIVTDSRGQETTYILNPITVNSYNKPSIESIEFERHIPAGTVDETQVYISATIKQTTIDGNRLGVPTVKVSNNDISNKITWYNEPTHQTIYTSTTAATKKIYGIISASEVFATGSTYTFMLSIADAYSMSDAKTEVLPSIYVTMDFQAGGKEIAFGAKADDDLLNYPRGLFKCSMDMRLVLNGCTITDSGTALSVTAGASTDDGKLAQAIIDTFDYVTAKEILEV